MCHAFLTCVWLSLHHTLFLRTYHGSDISGRYRVGRTAGGVVVAVAYRRQIRQKGNCRLLVCRCGFGGPWCLLHVRAGSVPGPRGFPLVPRFHSLGSNGSVPVTNALSTCGSARLGTCALQRNFRIPLSPRRWECAVELSEYIPIASVMVFRYFPNLTTAWKRKRNKVSPIRTQKCRSGDKFQTNNM